MISYTKITLIRILFSIKSHVKMISLMLHKMKTTSLGEPVQVLEPLESHIEEDNEG